MTLIASIITFSEKKELEKKNVTLDMVPSPSTWNPRPSTLDKKIDSLSSTESKLYLMYVIFTLNDN